MGFRKPHARFYETACASLGLPPERVQTIVPYVPTACTRCQAPLPERPAPGDPELGTQVKGLIEAAGLPVATDGERGFDHGVFVPFLIVDPKAEIPVVMLSLRKDLDPAFHIKIGKALQPLRDQGVAIVGSGMSFHDLRHFRDGDTSASAAFDAWLDETAKAPQAEREARLAQWDKAPSARACHSTKA